MPFREADRIFCFGVLQHTPDPREAFSFCCDTSSLEEASLRICTLSRLAGTSSARKTGSVRSLEESNERLYRWTRAYVDAMWPVARMLMKVPIIGKQVNWRLLIADYNQMLRNDEL